MRTQKERKLLCGKTPQKPVDGGYESKYRDCDDTGCGYLIEQIELGSPRLLFPSAHSADIYLERENLKLCLTKAAAWGSIQKYTLQQLSEVKRILECVRPDNGLLTLEELECMVGEQVWIESNGDRDHGAYRTVEGVDFIKQVLYMESDIQCYNYGELGHWQAYRHKPEEVQHED